MFLAWVRTYWLCVFLRTSPQDSGSYVCVASNVVNHQHNIRVHATNSPEVVITVKGFAAWPPRLLWTLMLRRVLRKFSFQSVSSAAVSKPEISFEVQKEGQDNYSVMVTCQSTKGTPPIAFSLHNSTQLLANVTAEDRYATFKVPLVFSDTILLVCQAVNGNQTVYSERMTVKVGRYRDEPQQMWACVYKPRNWRFKPLFWFCLCRRPVFSKVLSQVGLSVVCSHHYTFFLINVRPNLKKNKIKLYTGDVK